jgi:hypothetical protein
MTKQRLSGQLVFNNYLGIHLLFNKNVLLIQKS